MRQRDLANKMLKEQPTMVELLLKQAGWKKFTRLTGAPAWWKAPDTYKGDHVWCTQRRAFFIYAGVK